MSSSSKLECKLLVYETDTTLRRNAPGKGYIHHTYLQSL
jgi:hypothetical protein